ncbi:MAG: macro domain-containing protein [Oscillospiraceae bacterium]|nr:macro domain-containing protein [Oscillospiraceae bacterium]
MPLQIIRNDITKVKCDAMVNAANPTLLGGGGVDGAIHKAAGKGLLLECAKLGGCKTGQAKATAGYKLPCKHVIHTVGPKWKGGNQGEEALLRSCYTQSLNLAKALECESLAFPLISSGAYRYPKDQALKVAVDVISSFLLQNEMLVYIVVFDKNSFKIGEKLFADIKLFIDDKYVDTHSEFNRSRRDVWNESTLLADANIAPNEKIKKSFSQAMPFSQPAAMPFSQSAPISAGVSLEEMVNKIDESFSQMLLRKIDEKGLTDSQCYKKANVDRKLFSKIRSDVNYHPSKTTAIAFAIALELSLEETKDMLMKAGFALSRSNKFDIIIEYFITSGNYNIFEINEALFAFDQSLLGA